MMKLIFIGVSYFGSIETKTIRILPTEACALPCLHVGGSVKQRSRASAP